jgi:hypothetical protein
LVREYNKLMRNRFNRKKVSGSLAWSEPVTYVTSDSPSPVARVSEVSNSARHVRSKVVPV